MRPPRSHSLVCLFAVLGGVLLLHTAWPRSVAAQSAPTCKNFVGWWQNTLGSTMRISKVEASGPLVGLVQGCYCSPSGTQSDWYPLSGWMNALPAQSGQDNVVAVSWTVRWGTIGSITIWSGYCRSGGSVVLSAPWYLVSPNSKYTWNHRNADTDTFSPATASTCSKPIPPWCK
jgi:hypothetical protein